jgi:phosphoglycolate phosphatase-like HAD superfamily hydrolase
MAGLRLSPRWALVTDNFPRPASDKLDTMAIANFDWWSFDAYLFDIDGTLVNAHGRVHYNSFHTALREVYGCEGRIDPVPVHGNTDIGILRAALEHYGKMPDDFESRLPAAFDLMCAEVERNADRMDVEICPSIRDLLEALRHRGKLIGVVTGNLERIGWCKLERAGLRHFFDFGSFNDQREKREDIFRHGIDLARKLRGAKTTGCFIGDTPNDVRAAACLGMPVLSVATGVYSAEELEMHSPSRCVNSCAELLSEH